MRYEYLTNRPFLTLDCRMEKETIEAILGKKIWTFRQLCDGILTHGLIPLESEIRQIQFIGFIVWEKRRDYYCEAFSCDLEFTLR